MAIVDPEKSPIPYTNSDVSGLMSVTRDIARTLVDHHSGWVRTMDVETLDALLYDALVELDYALLPRR